MADISRIVRSADTTAARADQLSAGFARRLSGVTRRADRRFRDLLERVEAGGPGSRTAIVQAGQMNRTRREVRQLLRDAGYHELVEDEGATALDAMAARTLTTRRLAQQSAEIAGSVAVRVSALQRLHLDDLLEEGDAIARELSQATLRGVLGTQSHRRIVRDLTGVLDRAESRVRTLYDTSLSIYGRQVEAELAGDDPRTKFAYLGPVDGKTRDFCLMNAGKILPRAEIDKLDNGQLGNPFLTGGGYNCRHQWTEISDLSELADVERVPEIEADRKAVLSAKRAAPRRKGPAAGSTAWYRDQMERAWTAQVAVLRPLENRLEAANREMLAAAKAANISPNNLRFFGTGGDLSTRPPETQRVRKAFLAHQDAQIALETSRRKLANGQLNTLKVSKPIAVKATGAGRVGRTAPDVGAVISRDALEGGTLEAHFLYRDGMRSRYAGMVKGKRTIKMGTEQRKTVFHELGHLWEDSDPRVHDAATAFLVKRTRGHGPPQHLSRLTGKTGYRRDEIATPGGFQNAYAGKWYLQPGEVLNTPDGLRRQVTATEVVSLGLEQMEDGAATFAKTDPEYFDFMINLTRGRFENLPTLGEDPAAWAHVPGARSRRAPLKPGRRLRLPSLR